ncbi:MAG: ASCH domain-containing protein [Mobilicoccus sp.]|nr:ASCH domain-containing protein [Mobilicoccus sp.]
MQTPPEHPEVESFWADAKIRAKLNVATGYFGPNPHDAMTPPAWSFGGTPAQADALLDLVLAGRKTATASALWDYEASGEPVPQRGQLSIVLDGQGRPAALIVTTAVRVVPFDEVDEEHAAAEGEGDGSLAAWRRAHERFFSEHADHDRGFAPDMPVVLEAFRVLHRAAGA